MLLTTTVNYADFYLTPSKLHIATLCLGYLSVATFLFIITPFFWLPIALLLCEFLFDEWLQSAAYAYQLQGSVRISSQGDVYFRHQHGKLVYLRPLTRWLIVLRVQGLDHQWLLVWRDSCTDASYRTLKMFTYLHFSPR
ncbi:protein YgfX [Photobacterium leiognathi]|uniref:protein YgfX n=1 Tax=Photobacterium leiognathi TaxID=553611 RepID=UPI002981CDA8|nr:protein YgfX [Photobacterium leiognathi]